MSSFQTKTPPSPGRLTTLAAEINHHHRQAESAMRSGLEHALAAGKLLIQAKAQCAHGDWGPWLAANFEGSARTARAYVQLARRWPEVESKMADSAVLPLDGALKMLASPKTAWEKAILGLQGIDWTRHGELGPIAEPFMSDVFVPALENVDSFGPEDLPTLQAILQTATIIKNYMTLRSLHMMAAVGRELEDSP